jgi:predicted ABC-type ATPase
MRPAGSWPERPPLILLPVANRSCSTPRLAEIDRLAAAREDFAFESTLSGRTYVSSLEHPKSSGDHLEIVFLRVASTRLALKRIAVRIRQRGHPVAKADV